MKGQASLEYLALAMVSLAMLCVSVMCLSQIKVGAERNLRLISFKSSATALMDAMDEACAMGNGNRRTVSLSFPLAIESRRFDDGVRKVWLSRFISETDDASLVLPSFCESDDASLAAGSVTVQNKEGYIQIGK
jgi:hypothetical protein